MIGVARLLLRIRETSRRICARAAGVTIHEIAAISARENPELALVHGGAACYCRSTFHGG
jgi:hypothetical protein